MRILKQSLLTAFIFLVQTVAGQSDSTLLEIIKDSTVMVLGIYDEGTQQIRFGEKEIAPYLGFSSAEVLKREAGIFIKEYGSGLLSTITHRGGSAAQTSVLWEGINLMNPMLGQSDLSLMPLAFVDNLSWQSGGNSALNGNNAIGGSLKISSRTEFNSGLKTMELIQKMGFDTVARYYFQPAAHYKSNFLKEMLKKIAFSYPPFRSYQVVIGKKVSIPIYDFWLTDANS
jgi:hypothetical protein